MSRILSAQNAQYLLDDTMTARNINCCLASVVISLLVSAASQAQTSLRVNVNDIRDPGGVITVALFSEERNFLKEPAVSKSVPAEGSNATVFFEGLEIGVYAVSVFHDKNRNGKLDSNVIGIPTEGFGFGNDAMGLFGPPSFRKASVTAEGKIQVEINLRYY